MDMKEGFVFAVDHIIQMFGLKTAYQGETVEEVLTSANQVNILIGLTDGLKGNVVVGFKRSTALKIASSMMGGIPLESLDCLAESAVGEMANMFVGTALGKMESETPVTFSPPTIVTGDRMFLMISRIKSKKLSFKIDDEAFNIAFCVE